MGIHIPNLCLLIKVTLYNPNLYYRLKLWQEQFANMKGGEWSPSSKSTIDSSPESKRKILVFTERSLYSDRHIFMENAKRLNLVNELEYVIY